MLSLPFTTKFSKLSHGQRDLYLASLVLAAVSAALLLGPVAAVGLAVSSALLLVTS